MTRTYINSAGGSDYKRWAVERTDGGDTVVAFMGVEAEPEIASYRTSSSTAAAISSANSHILQVMAGASLRVGIRKVTVYQVAAANASASIQMAAYRLTTAGTGGTAVTPAPLDPADAASGAAAMILPTAKGTEGTLIEYRQGQINTAASSIGLQPVAVFDFTTGRTKPLWIAAGTSNGMAIKVISSDSTCTLRCVAELVETSVS